MRLASSTRLALVAALTAAVIALPARAGVLDELRSSISSLWSKKSSKSESAQDAWRRARALKNQSEAVHVRLERTQRAFLAANASYQNIASQTKRTENRIVRTRRQVHVVSARFNRRRILFGRRLSAMQRGGKFSYLQIFLGSRTLSDLTRRAYVFEAVTTRDAELQAALESDRNELQSAHNTLVAQWHQRNELKQAAFKEWLRVASAKAEQQRALYYLNKSRYAQVAYAQEQARSSRELTSMIQSLESRRAEIIGRYEAEEARRAAQGVIEYSDSGSMPNSGGGAGWKLPVNARLSSRYGMRFHPVLHRMKLHTGDDLAAPEGTPFRAAHAGRVMWAGWKTAYGNTIIIDEGNGVTTLYAHASRLNVRAGQPVRRGQYIGNVGSTGWSTGPHLHFEVRKNGVPINPRRFLRR
jgi:murein DD-endopeptidase MepM/ murein hydrolase activator NlpD